MASRITVAIGFLLALAPARLSFQAAPAPRVAIGLCAPLGDLEAVKAARFDYRGVPHAGGAGGAPPGFGRAGGGGKRVRRADSRRESVPAGDAEGHRARDRSRSAASVR